MSPARCPVCEKPFELEATPAPPFCGERCRLIDLRRWLDEDYGLLHESEETTTDPQTDE